MMHHTTLGIAHRDLKPDNILIRDGVPKIADFGFAKSIQQITQNKAKEFNVGTPLYMSPETLTKNEYSDKTDIWALGVMFYELVFGTLITATIGSIPWKANTEPELLQ
jgi:serine/threonine protein kinase